MFGWNIKKKYYPVIPIWTILQQWSVVVIHIMGASLLGYSLTIYYWAGQK